MSYDPTMPVNFNLVKEGLVQTLAKEKFITQEQADYINSHYSVVVVKKNWLGKMVDKLLWKQVGEDEIKIAFMKIV